MRLYLKTFDPRRLQFGLGRRPDRLSLRRFSAVLRGLEAGQLVNVDVTKDGVTSLSGTYNVSESDYASPQFDISEYKYGDFTAAAGNTTGVDTEGLSGAQVPAPIPTI